MLYPAELQAHGSHYNGFPASFSILSSNSIIVEVLILSTKIIVVFLHYIIAKRCKEGYLLRLYEFMTIIEQLMIQHEVMNG